MKRITWKDFDREIVKAALLGLIRSGDINPRRKTREQLVLAAQKLLARSKVDWQVSIDHQRAILTRAAEMIADGDVELGVSLYATYIEHALNFVIHAKGERLKLAEAQLEVLKDTNIRAKFLWVHILVGKSAPKVEYDRLGQIVAARNRFVHYKWTPTDEKHSARASGAASVAPLVVQYLQAFIRRHVDRGFEGFDAVKEKA